MVALMFHSVKLCLILFLRCWKLYKARRQQGIEVEMSKHNLSTNQSEELPTISTPFFLFLNAPKPCSNHFSHPAMSEFTKCIPSTTFEGGATCKHRMSSVAWSRLIKSAKVGMSSIRYCRLYKRNIVWLARQEKTM